MCELRFRIVLRLQLTLHVCAATIVVRIIIVHIANGNYKVAALVLTSLGVLLRNVLSIYITYKVGTTCRHRNYNCHLTGKLCMAETKQLIVIDCY